jgi:cytoskeletal protein RodZ
MQTTVGAYLQSTRKEKGLTLDQVAIATRIRIPYLQALEDDEIERLPSKVQGRGFLRLYADFLALPVQTLLEAWPDKPLVFPDPSAVLSAEVPASQSDPNAEEAEDSAVTASEDEPTPSTADENSSSPSAEPADQIDLEIDEAESEADKPEPLEQSLNELPDQTAANLPQFEFAEENLPVEEQPQPVLGSQEIFNQIGERLRSQREKLSVSIEDVEHFTRLRAHYIRALEEGRLADLPSLVQGRGMLSNYADFLNLDGEQILSQFADALQARRLELMKPEPVQKKTARRKDILPPQSRPLLKRFLTPDVAVGVALFSALLIFVIWGTANFTGKKTDSADPTAPSLSDALVNVPPTETSEADLILTGEPTSELPPGANTSGGIVTGEDLITPEATETLEGQIPENSDFPVQLVVVVNQRVWLKVLSDDKVVYEGRAIPGNAYAYEAENRIELTAANGAAIELIYNQRSLGIMGDTGDVVRMIFTAAEMQTPTPMFTATATPTLQPTFTLQATQTLAETATQAAQPSMTITPFVP